MKPILFNTEMVQAILDGRKTVTRRVVKPQPHIIRLGWSNILQLGNKGPLFPEDNNPKSPDVRWRFAPYKPGDILYVRETWSFQDCDSCGGKCDTFPPDRLHGKTGCFVYRTDYGTTEDDTFPPSMFKWRPSIHMPKEAARIFLKVTDIRVERLQDITIDRLEQEGVKIVYPIVKMIESTHLANFISTWDSTIKKSDLDCYGWDANPWVWVIEFERIEKPKEGAE